MATYDGLTSSSSPPPPEPRGQGREGGEGFGCWVVVGRVSLQASGHILYWMPRKRHMAKIMAKSCRESRCRLVRLGPHPSTGRPPCGTRAGRAVFSAHSCCGDSRRPLATSPSHQPRGPFARCSHREKGALETKRHGFKSSSLLATGDRGPNTSLLWACYASRTHRVPGTDRGAFLETFSKTRKTGNPPKVTQLQARKPGVESRHLTPEHVLTA